MNRPHFLFNRADVVGPVALTVACGAGFAAVYALTVRTVPGRQFGDASLRGSLLTRSGVAAAVDTVLGVVSIASLLAGIAVIAMVALARLQRVMTRTKTTTTAEGGQHSQVLPRRDGRSVLTAVGAFYLDLAEWADDDPAR